jgi:VWFA-related protein
MTRIVSSCVASLLAWTAGAGSVPPPAAQDPQKPFRAGTSAVMVDVSVKERAGRVVTGLTAADFVIKDNDVVQEIAEVSYGRVPIDVTIGLDVSYSVTGPLLERLRRAVGQLMRELRKEDRIKLMLFNMRVNRTVDFTNDWSEVERALDKVMAGGATSLFDTLSVAMVSASHADRRQLLVFFTDGNDGSSTTTPAMLQLVAERTRATVSFVVLPSASAVPTIGIAGPGLSRPSAVVINPVVHRLATETGGSVMMATALDLGVLFLRALDAFRSTYVLHYSPQGVDRRGFHTITVEVKRPNVVVQARRGYFGG